MASKNTNGKPKKNPCPSSAKAKNTKHRSDNSDSKTYERMLLELRGGLMGSLTKRSGMASI